MPETPSIPTSRADWHAVRSVEECLDILCAVYDRNTQSLRDAFKAYIETSAPPDPKDVANGLFAYPKIRLTYLPEAAAPAFSRAFGKFDTPGVFETDIARPALFRDYLAEQLEILFDTYDFKMVKMSQYPKLQKLPLIDRLPSAAHLPIYICKF